MSREYEKALQEFAQSNQDFEGRRVAELIVDTGERLTAFCLHEQVAGEAMIGLHRNFCLPDFPCVYRKPHPIEGESESRKLTR
jgi:hypothetical protein